MNRIFLFMFFVSIGSSVITPMLGPIIFSDAGFLPLSTNADRIIAYSYVMAAYSIGMIAGNPLWGVLSDRFGRRRSIFLSLVFSIFGLLISLASMFYAVFFIFILGRLMDGLMAGRRTIALSILSSASSNKLEIFRKTEILNAFGLLAGPLIGGLIVPSAKDLPLHHYSAPLVLMLAFVVTNIFLIRKDKKSPAIEKPRPKSTSWAFLLSKKSISLYSTFLLFQTGWYLFLYSLLPYIAIHYQFTPFQIGMFFSGQILTYIMALTVASPLLKRRSSEALFAGIALIIGTASLLAMWRFGDSLIVFIAGGAATIAGAAIVTLIFSEHISGLGHADNNGVAIGIQNGIIGCSGLLASLSNGFLTRDEPLSAFLMAASLFFIAASAIKLLTKKRNHVHS